MTVPQKPGRPFGLTLAILLSIVYFSVLPLLANMLVWSVRQRFIQMQNETIAENLSTATGIPSELLIGIEGLPEINYWQVLVSLIFVPIAVFAWRGRPSSMRFVLMFAIIAITIFNLILTFSIPPPNIAEGVSSYDQFVAGLSQWNLWGGLLVVLYVVWYINRAPARAFFRGYYLKEAQGEQK